MQIKSIVVAAATAAVLAGGLGVQPAAAVPTVAPAPADRCAQKVTREHTRTGRYLEADKRTPVSAWHRNSTNHHKGCWERATGTQYNGWYVRPSYDTRQCTDASDGRSLTGTKVLPGTCNGRGDQRFATAPASEVPSAAVKKVRVKGTHVALRECPRTGCRVVVRVSNATLRAYCQTNRHTSKVSGNKWWTKVSLLSGSDPAWVSNHYVRGAAPKVPRLSTC
ncbi:hypothetical protein [Streptomyces achromogenes]|uniref:hypothetical protein n=1 Tax=Streptomyces achromogenes TaxID=67255 RepID=UPI00367F9564